MTEQSNTRFAKSRSGPSARDSPAAWRPEGLVTWQHRGLVAQSWFSTVFLSSSKFTRMHRSASGLGVQKFEFVYHFNNHFNPFRSFLSLHVAKWKTLSFSVYLSVYRTRLRGSPFSNDVSYCQTTVWDWRFHKLCELRNVTELRLSVYQAITFSLCSQMILP